jgi:2-hydroxy-4-carboxymuconate semialdehyde hemiacetal dehydrogenase
MRIGIVGYGAVAAIHVKGLQRWGADVCCVYGPNADKAKAFAAGNRVAHSTTDIDTVFSESDAVIIASPSARHFEQAHAALRAGLHCLVELPACTTAAEAHNLSRLADSGALTLQCAHTTRFLAGIRRISEWLHEGVLGEVRHIIGLRAIPPRVRSWLDDAVLHHAAHHIDLLLHWFGSLTPLACVAHPSVDRPQDAALLARLENGAPVSISVSYTSRLQETRLTLIATDHTITTDGFSSIEADDDAFAWRADAQESYEAAIQAQDRAFVESCSGRPGGVPWGETVRLAECLDVFRKIGGTT